VAGDIAARKIGKGCGASGDQHSCAKIPGRPRGGLLQSTSQEQVRPAGAIAVLDVFCCNTWRSPAPAGRAVLPMGSHARIRLQPQCNTDSAYSISHPTSSISLSEMSKYRAARWSERSLIRAPGPFVVTSAGRHFRRGDGMVGQGRYCPGERRTRSTRRSVPDSRCGRRARLTAVDEGFKPWLVQISPGRQFGPHREHGLPVGCRRLHWLLPEHRQYRYALRPAGLVCLGVLMRRHAGLPDFAHFCWSHSRTLDQFWGSDVGGVVSRLCWSTGPLFYTYLYDPPGVLAKEEKSWRRFASGRGKAHVALERLTLPEKEWTLHRPHPPQTLEFLLP